MSVVANLAWDGASEQLYADAIGNSTALSTTYYYAVVPTTSTDVGTSSPTVSGTTPAAVVVPADRYAISVEGGPASTLAPDESLFYENTTSDQFVVQGSAWSYPAVAVGGLGTTTRPNLGIGLFPPAGTAFGPGTYPLGQDLTHAHGEVTVGNSYRDAFDGTLTINRLDVDASDHLVTLSAELDSAGTHFSIRYGVTDSLTAITLTTVDAGQPAVGATVPGSVTYTNVGDTPVTVSSVAVGPSSGAATTDWSLAGTDTCSGKVVAAGSSCTVGVSVKPSTPGTGTADLVVNDNTPAATHHRTLTVYALATPHPPVHFWATRASDGSVRLTWTTDLGTPNTASSYQVSAGSSPDALSPLGTVSLPSNGPPYLWLSDPDTADSLRYYAVTGTNVAGTSQPATLAVDARVQAPSRAQVSPTVGSAVLNWVQFGDYNTPFMTFDIYKGATPGGLVKAATTSSEVETFSGLTPGATYYVGVVARSNTGATGPMSVVQSFTVPRSQLVLQGSETGGLSIGSVLPGSPGTVGLAAAGQTEEKDPAVSPNGLRAAFSARNCDGCASQIWVTPIAGGRPYKVTDGWLDHTPAWSPDGHQLAFVRSLSPTNTEIRVVGASGGTAVLVPNSSGLDTPTWLGPRTLIAAVKSSTSASLVKIDTISGVRSVVPTSGGGSEPTARPDGTEVAFLTSGHLYVVNLASGARRLIATPTDAPLGRPAWSRDQGSLFYPAYYDFTQSIFSSPSAAGGSWVKIFGGTAWAADVSTPDTTPPSVTIKALPGITLASRVTISFIGSDALNGIRSYDVRYTRQTATTSYPASTLTGSGTGSTSLALALAPGVRYCFSVRATDRAGNTSSWTAATCTSTPLDDRNLKRSMGFAAINEAEFYLGTASKTTTYGQTLSTTVSNQPLYLVATTCAGCGTLEIRKGTTVIAVINLASRTTTNRRLIAIPYKYAGGSVSIRVRTAGKPVIIDGLLLAPF